MVLQSSRQDCREKKSRAQSRAAAWATLETSWARLSRESPPSAGNSAHMVAQYSSSVGHDQAGGKTRAEGLWKCFFGRGILCLVFVFGCSPVTPNLTEKDNFLARPQMNPGSCAVEIFFVRFPVSSPLGNDELWREIDETRVPAEARQLLWANGLRAGVVGAGLTPGIVSLLGLKGLGEGDRRDQGPITLAENLTVAKRHLQLPPRDRREVLLGPQVEQLTLFVAEKKGVRGRTFEQAQPILALMWSPVSQGQICLRVTPEVTFGQPQTRYSAIEGHFRLDVVRPRESFLDLQVAVTLTPGEMLVVGCLPDRPGTLGHQFFVQQTEQKVVIFRPSQVQHDDLFCPEEFLRLAGASSP